MNFDQEYAVKFVRIFVMKNGAQLSNLEDGAIYVGDTLCGRIGPKLPENDYITVACRDLNAKKINIFLGEKPAPYGGTRGTSLRIQAKNPGVLVVCDVNVKI